MRQAKGTAVTFELAQSVEDVARRRPSEQNGEQVIFVRTQEIDIVRSGGGGRGSVIHGISAERLRNFRRSRQGGNATSRLDCLLQPDLSHFRPYAVSLCGWFPLLS
jgi:hypothetical protein